MMEWVIWRLRNMISCGHLRARYAMSLSDALVLARALTSLVIYSRGSIWSLLVRLLTLSLCLVNVLGACCQH